MALVVSRRVRGPLVVALAVVAASVAGASSASALVGGSVTNFPGSGLSPARAGTLGPDGALWFVSQDNVIERVTTSGEVSAFTDPSVSIPTAIAAGPDGAMWFTNDGNSSIGRITMDGTITHYNDPSISNPLEIVAGPGGMWFTNNNSVDRIAMDGTITTFPFPSGEISRRPWGIAAVGPSVFFTDGNLLGRITELPFATETKIVAFAPMDPDDPSVPQTSAYSLTVGSDGRLWTVLDNIGRRFTSRRILSATTDLETFESYDPGGATIDFFTTITSGPDGNLWLSGSRGLPPEISRLTTAAAITVFRDPLLNTPWGITAGPDGAMWFGNGDVVGRIAPDGTVTNHEDNGIHHPGFLNFVDNASIANGIVAGPDGAMWFANPSSIGRITTDGTSSSFTGQHVHPTAITRGPDGAVWFTDVNNDLIGRITTDGAIRTVDSRDFNGPRDEHAPTAIAAGADGGLWYTNAKDSSIGRVDPASMFPREYKAPGLIDAPSSITAGPDGAMWFTNENSIGRIALTANSVTIRVFSDPKLDAPASIVTGPDGALWFLNGLFQNFSVGRMTTAGVVTVYSDPSIAFPVQLTAGPDGAMWFTNYDNNSIGRITMSGLITNYTDASILKPTAIAAGPDGALWFTNSKGNSIGRISALPGTKSVAAPATKAQRQFSATLTDSGGTPIAGQTMVFSLVNPKGTLDQVCVATTNSLGTATCSIAAVPKADMSSKSYKAVYAGSAYYLPSTSTGTFR